MDKERKRTSPFYIVMTVIMTAVSVVVAALIVATLLSDEDEGLSGLRNAERGDIVQRLD